jgi:hypothetical protein
MTRAGRFAFVLLTAFSMLAFAGFGCSGPDEDTDTTDLMKRLGGDPVFETTTELLPPRHERAPETRALFGDLHVHTTYSFDAFAFGTLATPYDAYRYAKGEAIRHPGGFDVQLKQPLDFYAVTDHAMFLGLASEAGDVETEFSKLAASAPLNGLNNPDNMGLLSTTTRLKSFASFLPDLVAGVRDGSIDANQLLDITRTAWLDTIEAADQFYDPGHFTTFVAYEYTTSSDDSGNLHRNVIFKNSDNIPAVPFSRFHSQNPEDLWKWMDALRAKGVESLAIPHNSNGSNGQMFKLVDWAGNPIDDAYVDLRIRNEPLVEITQVKGTSETHPSLSTRDEWANFEIAPFRVATSLPSAPPGSYVRDALRRGLALENQGVGNPYSLGFVGASDTHTGAASLDESNYFGKLGVLDRIPELRGSVPLGFFTGLGLRMFAPELYNEVGDEAYISSPSSAFGASGITGVWAAENTRESIYEAFRRKETFATSGPRIQLRFFASFDFDGGLIDAPGSVARAYETGVAMGSELDAQSGTRPEFLVWALADPQGAPLQRVQIIKGWSNSAGETFEEVYDVACAGGAKVNRSTNRCPDNGARVNIEDCSTTPGTGVAQLRKQWRDRDYDPDQRAFYYARVLENPTCRWSTWDAMREGVEPRADLAKTIQERAWSSPIWIAPRQVSAASVN